MIRIPLYNSKKTFLIDDVDEYWVMKLQWGLHSLGYVRSSTGHYLHRVIMRPPEGMTVDHINRDKLDNRRENLRVVTLQENCRNRPDGKFGKYIYADAGGYVVKSRKYYVGLFHDLNEAKEARDKALCQL